MSARIAWLALKDRLPGGHVPIPERMLSPEFRVELVETLLQVFPTDPTELLLSDLAYLEAAMRAESSGVDAAVVGAAADYGIPAIRAAVEIPVVDCGQASIAAAVAAVDRFGIVTIWPRSMAFVYDRLLRSVPAGKQCVSVRHVSTQAEQATLADEDNFITQMKAGREHMVERILREIEASVADGCEAIILGCNCMTPVAETLARRTSVPIIDPTAAGYQAIRSMLELGVRHTRDVEVPLSKRQSVLAEMLRTAQAAGPGAAEECPVCLPDDEGVVACDVPVAAPEAVLA